MTWSGLTPELDAAEVAQALGEEAGRHEQDEGQGDLGDDQAVAQAQRLAPGGVDPRPWPRQRARRVEPRGAVRGPDAEEDARPASDRAPPKPSTRGSIWAAIWRRSASAGKRGEQAVQRARPRAAGRGRRRRPRRRGTRRSTGAAAARGSRRSPAGCRTRAAGRRRARPAVPRGSSRRSGGRARPSPSGRASGVPNPCCRFRRAAPPGSSSIFLFEKLLLARVAPSSVIRGSRSSRSGRYVATSARSASAREKPGFRRPDDLQPVVLGIVEAVPERRHLRPSSSSARRGPRAGRPGCPRRCARATPTIVKDWPLTITGLLEDDGSPPKRRCQ